MQEDCLNSSQTHVFLEHADTELCAAAKGSDYFKNMLVGEKAPIDTARLRRSSRSTRYDGFKVPQVTDVRKTQSKVKPRGRHQLPVLLRQLLHVSSSF